jgi:hypothetical protein
MKNNSPLPSQATPLVSRVGITMTVDVSTLPDGVVATNEAMLVTRVSLVPRPVFVLLFVQLKVVPGLEELKFIAPELSPLHRFKLLIEEMSGTGLTQTVSPEEITPLHDAPESLINN